MPASLTDLIATKSREQYLRQILAALQGVGHTQRIAGSGLGLIYGSGVPTSAQNLYVQILSSGGLGVGTFQYSLNGGTSYTGPVTIPSSGVYAVPGTAVSLNFDVSNASSVLNPYVAGDVYAIALTVTTVPVTAWQPGSLPLTLMATDADVDADLSQAIQAVALGGYLATAKSDWLDLLALNQYNLTRHLATYAAGVVTLTAAVGSGPYNITAGQLTVATASGVQFTNTTGGTLPAGGTLQLPVQALVAGAAANVGNGTINRMITALAGVSVNNPDPGSGTWLTAFGADTESDDALAQRCRDRWSGLGLGATAAAYDSWARAADPSVTRTNIYVDAVNPGQVDVVIAGSAGPLGAPVVAAVQAYINSRAPLTATAVVQSATAQAVTVNATINVAAANLALAQQQCPANLQALIAATPLGGTVYRSNIYEALSLPLGVRDVTISLPASDVALTPTQVATLTQSLTFNAV